MKDRNLMWDILQKNDMMKGNTELMELVMNITGTLILMIKVKFSLSVHRLTIRDLSGH